MFPLFAITTRTAVKRTEKVLKRKIYATNLSKMKKLAELIVKVLELNEKIKMRRKNISFESIP